MALGALESTTVQMPAPRHWRHRSNLICYIDMTGFVAIMLFFVCVFMILPVLVYHPTGVSVDLAPVNHAISMRAADREDALLIGVLRDGRIFLRADPIQPRDLPVVIQQSIREGAERKVYLKADARAKYSSVKEVIDGIHAAGIEQIGILVEQRRPPAPTR